MAIRDRFRFWFRRWWRNRRRRLLPVWAKAVAVLSWFTALSNLADFFIASIVRPSGLFWSQAGVFQETAASVNSQPVPEFLRPGLTIVRRLVSPAATQNFMPVRMFGFPVSSGRETCSDPGDHFNFANPAGHGHRLTVHAPGFGVLWVQANAALGEEAPWPAGAPGEDGFETHWSEERAMNDRKTRQRTEYWWSGLSLQAGRALLTVESRRGVRDRDAEPAS